MKSFVSLRLAVLERVTNVIVYFSSVLVFSPFNF